MASRKKNQTSGIETELRRAQRTLSRVHEANREDERRIWDEQPPDPLDRSLKFEEATLLARLADAEEHELAELGAALERMRSGTYGLCEECGERIDRERLRALPEARLCIGCSLASEPRGQRTRVSL